MLLFLKHDDGNHLLGFDVVTEFGDDEEQKTPQQQVTDAIDEGLLPNCDDWIELSEEQYVAGDERLSIDWQNRAIEILPPEVLKDDVNAERDKREQAGFAFNGKVFQFDIRSKTNISGAAQMAFMAIVNGAEAGDYRWNGGNEDFSWIAADNSMMKMDAQTVVAFGQAAAAHEQSHIMAARALKEMQPIPLDYDDNERWPKSVDEI